MENLLIIQTVLWRTVKEIDTYKTQVTGFLNISAYVHCHHTEMKQIANFKI